MVHIIDPESGLCEICQRLQLAQYREDKRYKRNRALRPSTSTEFERLSLDDEHNNYLEMPISSLAGQWPGQHRMTETTIRNTSARLGDSSFPSNRKPLSTKRITYYSDENDPDRPGTYDTTKRSSAYPYDSRTIISTEKEKIPNGYSDSNRITSRSAESPVTTMINIHSPKARQSPTATTIIQTSDIVTPTSPNVTVTQSRQIVPPTPPVVVKVDQTPLVSTVTTTSQVLPPSVSTVTATSQVLPPPVPIRPYYNPPYRLPYQPPPGRFWPNMYQFRHMSQQPRYQFIPPTVNLTTNEPLETVKTTNVINTNPTVNDQTVLRTNNAPLTTVDEMKTLITAPNPAVTTVVTDNIDRRHTGLVTRRIKKGRGRRRVRRFSAASTTSSYSTYTTSSGTLTSARSLTPRPHLVQHVAPQPIITQPIQQQIIQEPLTTIVPHRRIVHRVKRAKTHSGYYSSDLDYGHRKVYKSDYKYRHYYCCNWCKGRWELSNRSCGCCEWFYGCPLWTLIFLTLLLLAIFVTFFTLLGLQPSINSNRRSETAQNRLLNRTAIVYGFVQNCGSGATGPTTTLPLCINTGLTSTVKQQLSSYFIYLNNSNPRGVSFFLIFLSIIITYRQLIDVTLN